MTIRIPAALALLVTFGLGGAAEVKAQPAVPARSPGFTPFTGVMGRGAVGVGGYYGLIRPQVQLQQLQNEINQANQNLNTLQGAVTNMVSSSLPMTGRGARFNTLGHWYPSSKYGSAGGGGATRYNMVGTSSPAPFTGAGLVGVVDGRGGRR